MTEDDVRQLESLLRDATNLPERLTLTVESTPDGRPSNARKSIADAVDLAQRIEALLRALDGKDSDYVKALHSIRFHEGMISRPGERGGKGAVWTTERSRLIGVVNRALLEFKVRVRISTDENSLRRFLRSSSTRTVVLTAVMSLLVGYFSNRLLAGGGSDDPKWTELGGVFANFEVLDEKCTVDLSKWTPTPIGDKRSLTGLSMFTTDMSVRKLRDEGREFCVSGGSSGSRPLFTSATHKIDQYPINMNLVGWPNMPEQALAVLHVPREVIANSTFPCNIVSTRYRGFSDESAEWCGTGIWHPTRRLEMTVLFPPTKPARDFVFRTAFFYEHKNLQAVIPDSTHRVDNPNSVTWIIDSPVLGNAYRIDWKW